MRVMSVVLDFAVMSACHLGRFNIYCLLCYTEERKKGIRKTGVAGTRIKNGGLQNTSCRQAIQWELTGYKRKLEQPREN